MRAKVELMIVDLMTFDKKNKTSGRPLGLYIHNAKRELAVLLDHL